MKKRYRILALALCLLGLFGCGRAQKTEQRPLRIGLLSIDDSLPFYMAEKLGLYEKNGVSVELVPFGSAADKERALEAGEIDGDMTDLVVAGLLQKSGTEIGICGVALGASPAEGRFLLVGAPNSGLRKPEQLAGVPVAVGSNTLVHYLADRARSEAGLTKAQIADENVPNLSLRYESLMQGSLKAAVLPDPLAMLAERGGATVIYDDSKAAATMSQSVVLFTRQSIEQQGERVTLAMRSYFEAMDYINQNPDSAEVREALATFCTIPKPLLESYPTPRYSPAALPDRANFDDVMAWLCEKDLLDTPYRYEELVREDVIADAKG